MATKQQTGSANPGFAHVSKRSRKGSDAIGVGDGQIAGADTALALRWVRGIDSSLDDITLRGEKLRAHLGDALLSGTLVRTMGGASSLVLTVSDPGRQLVERGLLSEPHTLELDGLRFSYVKLSSEGINMPLSITYIPEIVADLMAIKGPHKALRAKVTRAEFCKRLALMAKPAPRFICPELHKVQPVKPITTESGHAKRALEDLGERGPGIDRKAHLKMDGQLMGTSELELADKALRIAASFNAPTKVMWALIMALMDETGLGKAEPNNVLEALEPYTKIRPAAEEISGFVAGKPKWTGTTAMGYAAAHPDAPAYVIAQAVQKSATADGSNYRKFEAEAKAVVAAFGGGAGEATSQVVTVPYAFKQQKDESNWKCMNEKAKEVNWRCFESAGWIYFMAEPTLLAQRLRMRVAPHAEGIQDIAFDYDLGKKVQQIKLTAWAHAWEAPPGTAVAVTGCGPANGIYLVQTISSPLTHGSSTAEITLKRPTKPLPEPSAERKTVTLGGKNQVAGAPGTAELGATQVPGHPELKPGISAVVNAILDAFPGLEITSTTSGSHATNSYHYLGRAADIASGDYGLMDKAAAWINSSGLWEHLTEGIHNPNLSVKDKHKVPSGFWGAETWAGHRNHIHVAV